MGDIEQLLTTLDQKIAALQVTRNQVAEAFGMTATTTAERKTTTAGRRGRPPGTGRSMTPEARAKIAEAQKRRWANQHQVETSPEVSPEAPTMEHEVEPVDDHLPQVEVAEERTKGGYRPRGSKK